LLFALGIQVYSEDYLGEFLIPKIGNFWAIKMGFP